MSYQHSHPADTIAAIMRRIYNQGMTTASGGNLTQREADGSIWASPTKTDKCKMQAADIMLIKNEGEIVGIGGLVGAGRSELAQCIFGSRQA